VNVLSEVSFGHEVELGDAEFDRIRSLIEQRAGIQLTAAKRTMVYNRLVRRLRETGCTSFSQYLDTRLAPNSAEWESFVNALTTNLTSFFREDYHFPILGDFLKKRVSEQGSAKVWCAAASTGQEPYSIAITALEALGSNPKVSVFSSDIDTEVLSKARAGVYPVETVAKLTQSRLQRFFLRGKGRRDGMVRVKPEVQALVRFDRVNLIQDEWAFREKFDAVFCRNVMIYFDRPTRQRLLERIHRVMAPGSLLFVGHSESVNESRDLFVLQGRTVYRRGDAGERA
jgi:chemotaxis protein methyltransferase CheR